MRTEALRTSLSTWPAPKRYAVRERGARVPLSPFSIRHAPWPSPKCPGKTTANRQTAEMVAALVFDFDGLIVDTEWNLFTAWKRVFGDHGADVTIDDFSLSIGTRGAVDWGELLETKTGRPGPSTAEMRQLVSTVEHSMR